MNATTARVMTLGAASAVAGGLLWWVVEGGSPPGGDAAIGAGSGQVEAGDQGTSGSAAADPAPALPSFPPFVVSSHVTEQWPRHDAQELDPLAQDLITSWRQLNFAEGLRTQDLFVGDIAPIEAAAHTARAAFFTAHGAERYLAVGWTAHADFERALSTLLANVRADGATVTARLREPTRDDVHAYYEACGPFATLALQAGLISDDGEPVASPAVIALLFRRKWAADAERAGLAPRDTLLPAPERAEGLRWRIESLRDTPVTTRLRWLTTFESLPEAAGYDSAFARAVILAEAGDTEAAQAALRRRGDAPLPAVNADAEDVVVD